MNLKKILRCVIGILFVLGMVNVSAITSNEVTYENEGISETLTNTIDALYSELKEYRTNGSVTSSGMLEGYTGYSKGKLISGSIPSKGSTTYTPGVNNQVITKGQYLSEEQVILGDTNLVSENIKEGVEIFGIKGSIKDNSGKTLEVTNIMNDDEFTYLNIPNGIYDTNSTVKVNNEKLPNLSKVENIENTLIDDTHAISFKITAGNYLIVCMSNNYGKTTLTVFIASSEHGSVEHNLITPIVENSDSKVSVSLDKNVVSVFSSDANSCRVTVTKL